MSTLRFPGRPFFAVAAAMSAAAMLAGCAGSQSGLTPQASTQSAPQSHALSLPDSSCTHQGNVRVKPCSVTLTVSAPEATVTVKAPKKDTVTEADNCGGETGIATVANEQGDTYIVTAGTTAGSCTATFTAKNKKGKQSGSATLSITNSV